MSDLIIRLRYAAQGELFGDTLLEEAADRIEVLELEVDMWRKHVPELEATIKRIEALFSEIEKIETAGDDIHTPWLVIMFEEALGEARKDEGTLESHIAMKNAGLL